MQDKPEKWKIFAAVLIAVLGLVTVIIENYSDRGDNGTFQVIYRSIIVNVNIAEYATRGNTVTYSKDYFECAEKDDSECVKAVPIITPRNE